MVTYSLFTILLILDMIEILVTARVVTFLWAGFAVHVGLPALSFPSVAGLVLIANTVWRSPPPAPVVSVGVDDRRAEVASILYQAAYRKVYSTLRLLLIFALGFLILDLK